MPETAGLARNHDSAQLRPRHVRTLALAGAVVGVVVLPIAAAQASPPVKNHDMPASANGQGTNSGQAADQVSATASPSAGAGAQALAPEFCGAPVSATVAGGTLRVQACVDQSAGSAAARVYVENGTGADQTAVLNLARADGSTVQVRCTIAAGDAAGVCSTSPTAVGGGSGAYNAIAELAAQGVPLSAGVVHVESGLVAAAEAQSNGQ
ncbi:hypothetical protein KGA66_26735 [Actinocrinis puniceicyclus]|uniref:Uncharacterized protein n=1 Tax=Actinocrinis puniceicyclus TaxID=977794 RepID=A0A8J7WVI0_9ACTN|nr:hypothetical protein [Actinocrinis puniceicyclus]MBS2966662.1 hypothetical protein [Actinocrinis puniceicyclus]